MKEYIERELLLIGVDGCISSLHAQAKGDPIQESAIKLVEATRDYIASLSATNVAPVQHGRWIYIGKYGKYECSVCHGIDTDCSDYYGSHIVTEQNFCPECGAKMDGVSDG